MDRKRVFIKNEISVVVGESFVPNSEVGNYVFNVLRSLKGEEFEFFTPKNISYFVKILNIKKRELLLEKIENKISKFKKKIVVCLPLMKGKKIKECSKKLIEIGIDELIPVELERSVKKSREKIENKILTWVGEAASQSGGIVPKIGETLMGIDEVISLYPDYLRLYFDFKDSVRIGDIVSKKRENIFIITGPEGGFSEDERVKLKNSGFISIRLNSNILRCETAPVVAVSILREILE